MNDKKRYLQEYELPEAVGGPLDGELLHTWDAHERWGVNVFKPRIPGITTGHITRAFDREGPGGNWEFLGAYVPPQGVSGPDATTLHWIDYDSYVNAYGDPISRPVVKPPRRPR